MENHVISMYFSPTHTTEKVVRAVAGKIAEQLQAEKREVNITNPHIRAGTGSFGANDILILGLPVYGGRIPSVTENYVHSLKGENTPAIIIAVYGNRDYDDALKEMEDILSAGGFNVIGAAAFIGEHSFSHKVGGGRPDAKDIAMANTFAVKILARLRALAEGKELTGFTIKGSHPYKERKPGVKFAPLADDKCVFCGQCVNVCPMAAIDAANPNETNSEKCIRCTACIKTCPVLARRFGDGLMDGTIAWLEDNFTIRKEPELFL